MIEVTFEHHNKAREMAESLRYMHRESLFGIGLLRCRMKGKHRIITQFETLEDAQDAAQGLRRIFLISALVTYEVA
jgi:hypothetical protein